MINNRLTADRAESLAAVRTASLANDQATSLLTGGVADAAAGGDSPTPAGRSAEADAEVAENLKDADKAVVSGPLGPAELTTLNLLERLVANLARVPGRKNIVYFSGGFPLLGALPQTATNAPDELPQLRRIVANAAGSNVHIYSVDAVGLDKGVGASRILTATQPEFANSSAANYAHGISMGKEDLLTDLALDTGGLLFLNQNFYVETLKRIDQDSSNYYVLAFRPDDKAKPKKGDIRSLRVKVHRPHVTVRARKGYVVQ
jgi:VWFA-related protein